MARPGVRGHAPPLLRMPLAHMHAGLHGVAAVCAALLGRAASGKGQHIDLALYDCVVSMHDHAIQQYFLSDGKVLPEQTGRDLPESTVYGVFTAAGGRHLVIAAQADETWKRLARMIGGSELAGDMRFLGRENRNENRDAALAIVRDRASKRPVSECIAELDAAGVPGALAQTIDEVASDPQIIERDMIIEQFHPVLGKVRLPNLPFRFSGCDTTPNMPAPLLGQHNREIAAELGFAAGEVEAMTADGVLCAQEAPAEPKGGS